MATTTNTPTIIPQTATTDEMTPLDLVRTYKAMGGIARRDALQAYLKAKRES